MLFSPNTVIASDLPAQSDETESPTPDPTPAPAEAPKLDPGPSQDAKPALVDAKAILEAINSDREEREKRARNEQERDTYKKRAEEAESKLTAMEKAKKNLFLDPASYYRKQGYTDKDLALLAEGLMFTLVPDKAPPDHRAKRVEAQMLRDREEREEQDKQREVDAEKRAAETQAEQLKSLETRYIDHLSQGIKSMKPGEYPASQAWFAEDHGAYTQELLATARQLSAEASARGERIDINLSGVAPHVEKKMAERAQRLISAFQAKQPAKPTTQLPRTQVQAPVEQTDTSKVIAGNPDAARLSEKERLNRALKAAFGI